jgi:RimJ/RimL family protein N-acetyltransferase
MMEERRFRLRSGHTVLIRPMRSDDAPALAAAVEQLSEQSRYRRFHTHMPRLNAQTLTYLTDIDHHDHEALVAVAPGSGDIVGVARFIRDTATPDTAELAIVVADAWHRRGLGTLPGLRQSRDER